MYSCIQFLKMLSSTLSPVPILQLPLRESAHWRCLALTSGRLLCGSATNWETSSRVPPINFHRSFHPLIPGKLCSSNLTCFSIDQYLTGLDPLLESPDCSYSLVQLAWWMLGLTFDNWLVLLLRLLAVGLIVTWGCSFYTLVLFSELVCVFTWVGLITSSRSSLIVETVATVVLARGYRAHCVPLHCLKRIPAHKNHQTG